MTLVEALDLVSRLTYKPGWTIEVLPRSDNLYSASVDVLIRTKQSCASGSGQLVELNLRRIFPGPLDRVPPEVFLDWVCRQVERAELHELDEWLKLDGKPLRNPHMVRP